MWELASEIGSEMTISRSRSPSERDRTSLGRVALSRATSKSRMVAVRLSKAPRAWVGGRQAQGEGVGEGEGEGEGAW